jgi:DNA-directed RNA polymerase sigma subunit (sigma70/sigma32)
MEAVQYIKQNVTRYSRKLTKEETANLSTKIQAAITFLAGTLGVNTFKGVDTDYIKKHKVLRDGLRARDELFLANQAFVIYKIGKKYQGSCPEEAIQLGFISLLRACELYDAKTGYAFTTYAGFWLLQALRLATQHDVSSFNAPSTLKVLRARLVREQQNFLAENGYNIPLDTLIHKCKTTEELALKALAIPFEFCVDSLETLDEIASKDEVNTLEFDSSDAESLSVFDQVVFGGIIERKLKSQAIPDTLHNEIERWARTA